MRHDHMEHEPDRPQSKLRLSRCVEAHRRAEGAARKPKLTGALSETCVEADVTSMRSEVRVSAPEADLTPFRRRIFATSFWEKLGATPR